MSSPSPEGAVEYLGDLAVVIVSDDHDGTRTARVAVVDTRTGATLLSLPPAEAGALGVTVSAKARRAAVVDDDS